MRINVLGTGPGYERVPQGEGEIWGVNNVHLMMPSVDRIIDIHDRRIPKTGKDRLHLDLLKLRNIDAYMRFKVKGYPNIKVYPLKEIKDEFQTDYFGSGFDYIIAMAIYEGATEIHIYGICVMEHSEYTHQKPSTEFWIGIAKGRGIKVEVHGYYSELLKTRTRLMYGYHYPQDFVTADHPEVMAYYKNFREDDPEEIEQGLHADDFTETIRDEIKQIANEDFILD